MPSDSFYVVFLLGGGTLVFMGLVFATSWDYKIASSPGVGWLFTIGGILLAVLAVGGFIDLRKRFRGWKIEHDYEELKLRKEELSLKKKKELQKEQEKQIKKSQSSTKKESPNSADYPTEFPLKRTYPKGFDPTKNKKTVKIKEPILETDKPVPDFLEQKQEKVSMDTKESTFTDEDYRKAIDDPLTLKSLWVLHKEPNVYANISELYDGFNEEPHRKPDLYVIFKKDEFRKLIHKTEENEKVKRLRLSPLGEKLIKQARKEKIFTWNEFLKRYGDELEEKI